MSRCALSPPETAILALDTSAGFCGAAVLTATQYAAGTWSPRGIEVRVEEMARGQAERLMPLAGELLTTCDLDWQAIDMVGVCTGPGNFTGIRIAVSAARGLALGLGVPAVGVSSFNLAASSDNPEGWAIVPAPRGMVYARSLIEGAGPAEMMSEAEAAALPGPLHNLADRSPQERMERLVRRTLAANPTLADIPPPAPEYIRPADAAPATASAPALAR